MKNKLWFGVCCLLVLITLISNSGAQSSGAQSEVVNLLVLRQQFKTELRDVRTEMLQQGIAFQEWKIKQIEQDLQRLTLEKGQIEESEQGILRRLSEIEKNVAPNTEGIGSSQSEQDGMKAELKGSHLQNLRSKRLPLLEQESALQTQLHEEKQQLQILISKLEKLKSEITTDQGR